MVFTVCGLGFGIYKLRLKGCCLSDLFELRRLGIYQEKFVFVGFNIGVKLLGSNFRSREALTLKPQTGLLFYCCRFGMDWNCHINLFDFRCTSDVGCVSRET